MMSSLFSEQGRLRLDEIVQPGLLCAFDFDGTLAPLMAQPDQVRLPAEFRQRLDSLAAYAPVAIITGRSLEDIRERIGYAPDFIIGNHGIEGLPGWEQRVADFQAQSLAWQRQLAEMLKDADLSAKGEDGIWLENKRYSLSVHYRHAADPRRTEQDLRALFARLDPAPKVVGGKYVFNLLPQEAADKGDALLQLMQACGARSAFYAGDDVTDEDVFRLGRREVLSLRVEQSGDTAADFFVGQYEDMLKVLDELINRLRRARARNWLQLEPASNA